MSLLRLFITVVVAVPLFMVVGWPHPWWITLIIAFLSIGTGYAVEAIFKKEKGPSTSPAADKTDANQEWELKMLLKKAIAAEGRGEWDQAIALFEQVIQCSSIERTSRWPGGTFKRSVTGSRHRAAPNQSLQQTAAAMLVYRGSLPQRAAAAAEFGR